MNNKIVIIPLIISSLLISSIAVAADKAPEHQPMYGGMDRTKDEQLIKEDTIFINGATRTFSTRELASAGYVERGFDLYAKNKLDKSMWRFNQAWLLDKNNHYVYLGFGLLLKKNEKPCEAIDMFKIAKEKGLKESGFLADYALTCSECAATKNGREKEDLFSLANKLHDKAINTPHQTLQAYVYHSWAKSYFLQGNFPNAKQMLEQSKQLGGKIDNDLLTKLNNLEG